MAIPASRTDFINYIKRKLGHPVHKVNVTDEQLSDRIDEAVNYYIQRHYGGSERVYLAHSLTALEVSEKKVVLDDSIIGVIGVFQVGFSSGGNVGTFDGMAWQTLLSDVIFNSSGSGSSTALADYVVMRVGLNTISEFLVGQFPIRYNERTDELFLDAASTKLVEGAYIIIEAHRKNDPEEYPDVWSDPWLQKYATELVRLQWGQNLSKLVGAELPGGVDPGKMGMDMMDRAEKEIEILEQELIDTWSPISLDMIG